MRNSCFRRQQNRVSQTLSLSLFRRVRLNHKLLGILVLWLMEQTEVNLIKIEPLCCIRVAQ